MGAGASALARVCRDIALTKTEGVETMTTFNIEFSEYLTIKSALREAVCDARAEARRGERFENLEMRDHYQEHASYLESLIEKLDSQAYNRG